MLLLRRGDAGPAVEQLRATLTALGLLDGADGHYDRDCDLAVRAFQQNRGLIVDGVVGEETFRAIDAARWRLGDRELQYTPGSPTVGDDVSVLQERLLELGYDAGRPDGLFGARTEVAVRAFQRDYGLYIDGVCGPATLRGLNRLGRKVVGGRPQLLRESTALVAAGPALTGKSVVIDPGHGGEDPGATNGSLIEAELAWELAIRLRNRLVNSGVNVALTREAHTNPSSDERARFANSTGAGMLISLHVDANSNPQARGVATYHFGTDSGVTSTVGEQLAGLVHREVVARTGLLDCQTHAKSWEILRLTTMPAIRLEVGYLSNVDDARALSVPEFRATITEAVAAAVQRLYLPAEADPPTGTFQLPI